MTPDTGRPEIDHHTLKLIVGIIAVSLPFLVTWFADVPPSELVADATQASIPNPDQSEIDSIGNSDFSDSGEHRGPLNEISAAYHRHNTASDIFVGFLFAIAAFLFAYNGQSRKEMILSKVAGVASLGVALFPCACANQSAGTVYTQPLPFVHAGSAAIMFFILAIFCNIFRCRAIAKGHPRARFRSVIYTVCGLTIVAAIILMGIDGLSATFSESGPGFFSKKVPWFIFGGESVGLIAFGLSWLTASRMLPVITNQQERIPLR